MNIRRTMESPLAQEMTVNQGFTLARPVYLESPDTRLISTCEDLAQAYPDVSSLANVDGENRLAIHLIRTRDIRTNRYHIGKLSLQTVLGHLLENVQGLEERPELDIQGFTLHAAQSPGRTTHHTIEAHLTPDSQAMIRDEVRGIQNALMSLTPGFGPLDFEWPALRPWIVVGTIPGDTNSRYRQSAKGHLNSALPLAVTMEHVQCTIPRQAKG